MRVNEIFYSIQGEGFYTGEPAVFIRLSGCNLKCSFCDTDHQDYTEMNVEQIVAKVLKFPSHHVVITGGEPLLQDIDDLLVKLYNADRYIQIETNGTIELSAVANHLIHWVTCSPKFQFCNNARPKIQRIDEVKVVYTRQTDLSEYERQDIQFYYLQPCDFGDKEKNVKNLAQCIKFIKRNPKWKLSLQTQKILKVR